MDKENNQAKRDILKAILLKQEMPNRRYILSIVSAGLCGRSASQPTETRLLPGEPGLAFLPRRCCEHRPKLPVLPAGAGEALLLASRKVPVQIGYCCWLEPRISSSPKTDLNVASSL